LAEEIGTIQNLRNSFNPILSVILVALDAPAIFMRTKALKALGQIVTSDSTILSAVRAVYTRLCGDPFYICLFSPMFVEALKVIFLIVHQLSVMLLLS
jgi:hypothetical protein